MNLGAEQILPPKHRTSVRYLSTEKQGIDLHYTFFQMKNNEHLNPDKMFVPEIHGVLVIQFVVPGFSRRKNDMSRFTLSRCMLCQTFGIATTASWYA